MNQSTQAFTLLELLIVILIIGLIASWIVPNLLGARQRAFDAAAQVCSNDIQMKQEIHQIDGRTYATNSQMIGDYAPRCGQGVAWEVTTASAETFMAKSEHAQGKKVFTVTPNSLVGVNRP